MLLLIIEVHLLLRVRVRDFLNYPSLICVFLIRRILFDLLSLWGWLSTFLLEVKHNSHYPIDKISFTSFLMPILIKISIINTYCNSLCCRNASAYTQYQLNPDPNGYEAWALSNEPSNKSSNPLFSWVAITSLFVVGWFNIKVSKIKKRLKHLHLNCTFWSNIPHQWKKRDDNLFIQYIAIYFLQIFRLDILNTNWATLCQLAGKLIIYYIY